MVTCFGIDELNVDAHAACNTLHGALKDIANAKFPTDLLQIDMPSFVGESSVAADHEYTNHARQIRGQALGHAIGEIFLLGIRAQIGERQND